MRIVIDTNIVFSAMLNTQSKIGQIIINGSLYFKFYSINLLKEEINKHQKKLLSISGYSVAQYQNIYSEIISKITFVDDIFLLDSEIDFALILTHDIDVNDTLFVALANQLKAYIWTGDKQLSLGLQTKGYNKILNTNRIYEIFLEYMYST